jgi:hypothetical protein
MAQTEARLGSRSPEPPQTKRAGREDGHRAHQRTTGTGGAERSSQLVEARTIHGDLLSG